MKDKHTPEEQPSILGERKAILYNNHDDWRPDPLRQGHYTVADLESLSDDIRAELLDGTIYLMSSPRSVHQKMLANLINIFMNYISTNNGKCQVEPAVGVYLDDDDSTELIPDLSIVCDPGKDDGTRIHGAPDLVIEILSPSTKKYDMTTKLNKYINAGVREYWMIDIDRRKVIVADNTEGDAPDYRIYGFGDSVPVSIYNGRLQIDFNEISKALGL